METMPIDAPRQAGIYVRRTRETNISHEHSLRYSLGYDDLRVLISGVPAGTLHQDGRGFMSFVYDESYRGIPLSLSMRMLPCPWEGR